MENQGANVLPNFKTSTNIYPLIGIIIFLIIMLTLIYFKVPLRKSPSSSASDVFIILFFSLLVFSFCIILLPSFKELKTLFVQISSVTYVLLYTIFLILFFSLISAEIINNYAVYILPLTFLLGLFSFYRGTKTDYIDKFNVNYERIKSIILIFCLITCYIVYYNKDPGGYISKYFGYTLLLTIIISAFAFLYLLTILTMPDTLTGENVSSKIGSILNGFSGISAYGSISFIIFLIIAIILITTYPGGFFNDTEASTSIMIILLLICIIWSILLVVNLFPEITNNAMASNKMNLFKRSLLALFGFIISGLVIFWLVQGIQSLSSESSIISFILNILLVIIILGLIYKTIYVQLPSGNSKKNGLFDLIVKLLFYIPCIFSDTFDSIGSFISGEYKNTTAGSVIMLIVAILLLSIYFITPSIYNKINLQGGNQLVNKPVYTNTQYSLGTYEELNGTVDYDYQYAISSWIFLDALGPNTNLSYGKYTSLLNFANKPNILYNGKTNTLMITMEQKDLKNITDNKLIDFDDNGNRIIYKKQNIPLQKWNNIIINYAGGVLDIFINGELVKSAIGVVPYYTLDSLTIGENNGISGGICNLVYFRKPLTSSNIYKIYNSAKNITPPTTNDSNETILIKNISQVNNSIQSVV